MSIDRRSSDSLPNLYKRGSTVEFLDAWLTQLFILTGICDATVLLYGSVASGLNESSSDIDLVFIRDELREAERNILIDSVKDLHRDLGLPLDDEVPFSVKLFCSWRDLENAAQGKCFWADAQRVRYSKVVKTKEFLSSEEIRLRLLLNALAGPHVIFRDRTDSRIGNLVQEAQATLCWTAAINSKLQCFDAQKLVKWLISDGTVHGEEHLGFKESPAVLTHLLDFTRTWIRRQSFLGNLEAIGPDLFTIRKGAENKFLGSLTYCQFPEAVND